VTDSGNQLGRRPDYSHNGADYLMAVRMAGGRERAKLLIRFHDLRHTCITKLAESRETSENTLWPSPDTNEEKALSVIY
jgi:integrase